MATGKVTDACYPRHRDEEFLRFLKKVARIYPGVQLHVMVDNYATHKHPDVQARLARNPRIALHVTPTSGSWLNMVEIFFGLITRQADAPERDALVAGLGAISVRKPAKDRRAMSALSTLRGRSTQPIWVR